MTRYKTIICALFVCYFSPYSMAASAQSNKESDTLLTKLKIPAIGKVVNTNVVDITNISEGRVMWLAEAGDTITKGQDLIRLDNPKLTLALKIQNAEKDKLEQELTYIKKLVSKSRRLYSTNGVSLNDLDDLEHQEALLNLNLQIVNAKRELLLFDIEELTIKAPFDGTVTQRFVSKGFYALKNQSMLTFISHDDQELDILVSNQYLARINDQIGINFDSRFGAISSSLKSIVPTVDPDNSMFRIRTKLPDFPWIHGEVLRVEIHSPN